MNDDSLRDLKKAIDEGFRAFTRAFLIAAERFMTQTPWPIITIIILAIAWSASRSWKVALGCLVTLLTIGYFDMWTTRCARSR